MRDQLGPVMERTLLVVIMFAFFGAGLVTLTSCSRIVFAMSRDSRFPAHRLMGRVNPPHPDPDPGDHPDLRPGGGADGGVAGRGAAATDHRGLDPAGHHLRVDNRALPCGAQATGRRKGAFDLGRFELPVAIGALVWSLLALFVLVTRTGRSSRC